MISVFNKVQLENGLPVDPDLAIADAYRWLPESAGKVVQYLEAYADKREYAKFGLDRSKPFFIYWDPPSPHEPIVVNDKFVGKSGAGLYGDFVVEIDHYVGQVLETLDRLGLSENTLVVFSSDNGPEATCYARIKLHDHYSMGQWRGAKRDLWEGGHRVPLIVRWPGMIEADTHTDQLVSLTDWMATFAEITGQELPEDAGEDSVSLVRLLKGGVSPVRKHLVHHTFNDHFAIRYEHWLFIDHETGDANLQWTDNDLKTGEFSAEPEWFREERGVIPHPSQGELFHLEADPRQTVNFYDKRPDKAKELRFLLHEIMAAGRRIERE